MIDIEKSLNSAIGLFRKVIDAKINIAELQKIDLPEKEKDELYDKEYEKEDELLSFADKIKEEYPKEFSNLSIKNYYSFLSGTFSAGNDGFDIIKIKLQVFHEQILNRIVNKMEYSRCLNSIVGNKKRYIVEKFGSHYLNHADKITFKIEEQGEETHNGGKVPAKVTFMLDNKEVFRIFLKPRNAKLDTEVINLFSSINGLESDRPKLPEYKIINLKYSEELYSMWEFIDGQSLTGHLAPMTSNITTNHKKHEQLSKKVLWMESVLRRINISDLHGENVILREVGSEPEIVPIDLESIQEGFPTGLYGNKKPNLQPIKEKERLLIEKFNKEVVPNCRIRVVIIPTSEFLEVFVDYNLVPVVAKKIMGIKKYSFHLNSSKLEDLILKDLINYDVPFLTEYKGVLYYGLSERGLQIGVRDSGNKKQEKV